MENVKRIVKLLIVSANLLLILNYLYPRVKQRIKIFLQLMLSAILRIF